MTTREQALLLVNMTKEAMNIITHQRLKRKLAHFGMECNSIAQLHRPTKGGHIICKKCGLPKPAEKFSRATGQRTYKKKNGDIVTYDSKTYYRKVCNSCTWPKAEGHNF